MTTTSILLLICILTLLFLNFYTTALMDQIFVRYMHAQWVNHVVVFHKNCNDLQFRISMMKLGDRTEPELFWGPREVFKLRKERGRNLIKTHKQDCPFCNGEERGELVGRRVFSK